MYYDVSYLIISDLRLTMSIGAYDSEKHSKQVVSVDIQAELPSVKPFYSDNLSDTVDYAEAIKRIQALSKSKHFHLVEHFAEKVSNLFLDFFEAKSISVKVCKVGIIPNVKDVGISIKRHSKPKPPNKATVAETPLGEVIQV